MGSQGWLPGAEEWRARLLAGLLHRHHRAEAGREALRQALERERQALERERQAARELRALDEMKNTFLDAVSHELRTPLATVIGIGLTLQRAGSSLAPEDAADLAALVARSAQEWRLRSGRELEVLAEPVVAWVDPAKVERVVENLLANAGRHGSSPSAKALARLPTRPGSASASPWSPASPSSTAAEPGSRTAPAAARPSRPCSRIRATGTATATEPGVSERRHGEPVG